MAYSNSPYTAPRSRDERYLRRDGSSANLIMQQQQRFPSLPMDPFSDAYGQRSYHQGRHHQQHPTVLASPYNYAGGSSNSRTNSSNNYTSNYALVQTTAADENRAGLGTPLSANYNRFHNNNNNNTATPAPTPSEPGSTPYNFNNSSNMSMQQLMSGGGNPHTTMNRINTDKSSSASSTKASPTRWTDTGREPNKSSSWKKWLLIVGLVLLIAGGVGGGIAGWKISQNKAAGGSSSSGSSLLANGGKLSGDPSVFAKDPRLHQSMWGIAYSPKGTMVSYGCNATLASVVGEIQLLSQLTKRIRTYGSDCNASWLVMEAITQTKVDMQVWLGAYIELANQTTTQRQMADTLAVVKHYGAKHIGGVTIGNEVLLNANESAASMTFVTQNVAAMRQALQGLNLGTTIPVGTSDAGSAFTQQFLTGMDFALANVHPWFAGTTIDDAAGWTWDFFQNNDVAIAGANTKMMIGETGWPSQAMAGSPNTFEGAVATMANFQKFLDTFVCQANANGTEYFFFEFADEPWKEIYKGVEPYWGIFDRNYNLKNVTIPNCPAP